MKNITFERSLIVGLLIAAGFGLSSMPLVLAALGLLTADTVRFLILNKKESEATKAEVQILKQKFELLEKSVNEKTSLMDNKLAGLGISRRNA